MNRRWIVGFSAVLALVGCASREITIGTAKQAELPIRDALSTAGKVSDRVWQEVVVSVTDIERSAAFFTQIGGYEAKWQGSLSPSSIRAWNLPETATGEALLLGPAGYDAGLIRLVRFDQAGPKQPTRPGARAWDTGCYFSLMVRMKDMASIYDDAIALGWWSETPMTYLEFGQSKLNVMIFRGPDGVQVQGYERLSPPLPEAIPAFDRLTGPFNIMQMVSDRDATYDFFANTLGFDTFYKGKPYVSPEPVFMPLGIPKNLTTSVRYQAGIVYPQPGEFGRMEMIEIMDLEGHDFAERCDAPNLGILAVRFEVDDLAKARRVLVQQGGQVERATSSVDLRPYGRVASIVTKTPDGANLEFYERIQ